METGQGAAEQRADRMRLVAAAALVAAQLFLFGPFWILRENAAELPGVSAESAGLLLAAFVGLFGLLAGLGLMLRWWAVRIAVVLAAAAFLMWIEGSLGGRFNLLDGSIPEWSAYRLRGAVEVVVAAGGLVAAWIWAPRLRRLLVPFVACLAVAQALPLLASLAGGAGGRADEGELAELATLSAGERNVFVLIADAVGRDHVTALFEQDERLRREFAGFRLFTDHLAAFPTTRFSIPSMLTGRLYDNSEPADDFLSRAYTGPTSITRIFDEAGFDTGIASTIDVAVRSAPADHTLAVERSPAARSATGVALALELVDLSLFRHAPIALKRWLFNDSSWRFRRLAPGHGQSFHAIRNYRFMRALVDALGVGAPGPTFRVVHVGGAHPPIVVDRDCRFVGVQEGETDPYREQVRCALALVAELVERLDRLGVLDSTFLVVTSDHGVPLEGVELEGDPGPALEHAMQLSAAMFMIKPFGGREPFAFDDRPTSAVDLPTILAAAIDGWDAADEALLTRIASPERERTFMDHVWQDSDWRQPFLSGIFRLTVGAPASKAESWCHAETLPAPDLSAAERSELLRLERLFARDLPSAACRPDAEAELGRTGGRR